MPPLHRRAARNARDGPQCAVPPPAHSHAPARACGPASHAASTEIRFGDGMRRVWHGDTAAAPPWLLHAVGTSFCLASAIMFVLSQQPVCGAAPKPAHRADRPIDILLDLFYELLFAAQVTLHVCACVCVHSDRATASALVVSCA